MIDNKIADKVQKYLEVHHKIIQKQLKVNPKILSMIEKYLKKDMYLQEKDKTLLMI